jgi:hypothetical protein
MEVLDVIKVLGLFLGILIALVGIPAALVIIVNFSRPERRRRGEPSQDKPGGIQR